MNVGLLYEYISGGLGLLLGRGRPSWGSFSGLFFHGDVSLFGYKLDVFLDVWWLQ